MTKEIKNKNGPNVYEIIRETEGHALIKCVWFSENEDLGDGIICEEEGQELWIAKCFSKHMEIIGE